MAASVFPLILTNQGGLAPISSMRAVALERTRAAIATLPARASTLANRPTPAAIKRRSSSSRTIRWASFRIENGVRDSPFVVGDVGQVVERNRFDQLMLCRTCPTEDVFVELSGAFEVASLVVRPGMGPSSAQFVLLVPEVAVPLDALPEELLRSRPVALLADGVGEHEQGKGGAPVVLEHAVELERLLGPEPARRDISAREGHVGGPAQGLGASRGRAPVSAESSFELTPPLDQMPLQIPESPERRPELGVDLLLDRRESKLFEP